MRTVSLRRAPPDVRARLAEILSGTGRPRPLYAIRTGFSAIWGIFPIVFVFALGCLNFGAKDEPLQGWITLLLYVPLAASAAYIALERLRASSGIPNGLYLLPLDLVEVVGDRATLRPLGELRQVQRKRETLVLSFRDGHRVELAFHHRAAVREACDELERAHADLLKVTYSTEPGASHALDPFFSLRADDSWATAAAKAPPPRFARVAGAVAFGLIASTLFLNVRNRASWKRAEAAHASWTPQLSPFNEPPSVSQVGTPVSPTADLALIATTSDDKLPSVEQERVNELVATGFANYARVRPAREDVPAFIAHIVERGRKTGKRTLFVSFQPEDKNSIAWSSRPAHGLFFAGIVRGLQHVFGEYFSPVILSVEEVLGPADVNIGYSVTAATTRDGHPTDIGAEYVFHVSLRDRSEAPPRIVSHFDLTMPSAKVVPELRPNTLYAFAADDEARTSARAFDRLFDELHEQFFVGPIHVPIKNAPQPF